MASCWVRHSIGAPGAMSIPRCVRPGLRAEFKISSDGRVEMRNLDQLDRTSLAHLFRDAGMTNKRTWRPWSGWRRPPAWTGAQAAAGRGAQGRTAEVDYQALGGPHPGHGLVAAGAPQPPDHPMRFATPSWRLPR